jgi:predicted AlkP superfamily phosphohydrolase/phosphomutase
LIYPEEAGVDLGLYVEANRNSHNAFDRVGSGNRRRVFDDVSEAIQHISFQFGACFYYTVYNPRNIFRGKLFDQMLSIATDSRGFVAVEEQWHKDGLCRGD